MANILVCDDSALIRLQLKNIFDDEEHEIIEAVNFDELKRESFSNKFNMYDLDLVFLDLYLGDSHGFKILEYFTNYYPELPVVIISVENRREIIMEALQKGADDYILKPFDKTFMLNKLDSILGNKDTNREDKYLRIKDYKNSFKNQLKLEIERSMRSGLTFSIIKFTAKGNISKSNLKNLKEIITKILRDIDRTFIIDKDSFLLLLPLTDYSGSEQVLARIENFIENKVSLNKNMEIIIKSFPDDFTKEIDFSKTDDYYHFILDKIEVKI